MYDFYFADEKHIECRQEDWLLWIKRLLPRWCNSIPDSEYLAIIRALEQSVGTNGKPPTLVETGCGASTIALLNSAIRGGGVLYTWDMNNLKASYLRGVACETLGRHYGCDVNKHWKFVGYNSTSREAGVSMLQELRLRVNFCFLDSEHTLSTVLGELNALAPVLASGAVVAIDDANYRYKTRNLAYINMIRRKVGLAPIDEKDDDLGNCFYVEVEKFLAETFTRVEKLKDSYKDEYKNDIFWEYFATDRESMSRLGMEKFSMLEHRFDSWKISSI